MNCSTQNEKIEMLNDEWLIVGIDVGSEKHFARMFNNRKIELSKKALGFTNNEEGFSQLNGWISNQLRASGKKYVICAMEPTGHYWYNSGWNFEDMVAYMNHGYFSFDAGFEGDVDPATFDEEELAKRTVTSMKYTGIADGTYTEDE